MCSEVRVALTIPATIMATTIGNNQTTGSTAQHLRAPVQEQFPKARVLVVEDDEDTRFMIRTMLEIRGFSVVEAINGEMAIALAANVQLDLILMDADLPSLDGLAATRHIRELPSACRVPIVMVSAHAQPAFANQALAAGCSDFIVKPFAFFEVDRVMARHLSQRTSG